METRVPVLKNHKSVKNVGDGEANESSDTNYHENKRFVQTWMQCENEDARNDREDMVDECVHEIALDGLSSEVICPCTESYKSLGPNHDEVRKQK